LLGQILLIVAIPALIMMGKDLGTTTLVVATIGIILFITGLRLRWIIISVTVAVALFFVIILKSPERQARITSFLNPEICQFDEGLQLWNSMLAIGSGGAYGVGLTESRIKAKYLPEAHTDFILSIVGEELGFIGMGLVIVGYVTFFITATIISLRSETKLGMLLGLGITTVITAQALINIIVITGSGPTKGMPAPFISYGGSNLIMCLLGTSLLMSIAYESVDPEFNEQLKDNITSFKDKIKIKLKYKEK
jgi:cell division protein FtsW